MLKLNNNNQFGFTAIELIVIIVFIALIAGTTVPMYGKFQASNNLDLSVTKTVQSLRRAQVLSQANDSDSNWGVSIGQEQILLFKGTSSTTRDINFDEIFDLNGNILVSGTQDVVFEKLTGEPQTFGSINFSSNNNETKTVTINEKGMLSY
ncbi:hypothetical protein C0580_03525 [Candidatus Parcubacteria bacterium]|nr:MAG: hypothetical protein C0580_03525 [Candidatus Parcubacteria bacterium]